MSQYGCTIPRRGRALIAKILAEKMPLKISRIMMGQGVCPEDVSHLCSSDPSVASPNSQL